MSAKKVSAKKVTDKAVTDKNKNVRQKSTKSENPRVEDVAQGTSKPYMLNTNKVFSDKKSADDFAKKLQSKVPARVVSDKSPQGKQQWRVQAGPFNDESKLNGIRKQIKEMID
jgi:cell division septation protein DedD